MKRILILVLLVGFNAVAEETHTENLSPSVRQQVDPNAQLNKLNELISACSPGRPGAGGAVGNNGDNSVFIPPVLTIPQTPGQEIQPKTIVTNGDASKGADVYSKRCVGCHDVMKGAPALAAKSKASLMANVESGKMPKDGSLDSNDKADLLAYLNTLPQ